MDEVNYPLRKLFPTVMTWAKASPTCRYRFDFVGVGEFCSGPKIPVHAHEYYEVGFVLTGNGILQLGTKTHSLEPGAVYSVAPGVSHCIAALNGTSFQGLFFNIKPEVVSSRGGIQKFPGLETSKYLRTEGLKDIITSAAKHHLGNPVDPVSSSLLARYLVNELLAVLTEVISSKYSFVVSQALSYLEVHLHEGLTIQAMAQYVGVSERTLRRRFQAELGMSVSEYIARKRVQLAEQYLAFNLPVSEVAKMIGFESPSQLSRLFVKERGVAPKAWQKGIASPRRSTPR